jgi:hypothetical protein
MQICLTVYVSAHTAPQSIPAGELATVPGRGGVTGLAGGVTVSVALQVRV